jgi:hypothetical protein
VSIVIGCTPGASRRPARRGTAALRVRPGELVACAERAVLLMMRLYWPKERQFLTEDPTSLAVGDPGKLRQLTHKQQQDLLSDPQTLNAYGYARDNPITNKDATGLMSQSEIDLLFKTVNGISGAFAPSFGTLVVRSGVALGATAKFLRIKHGLPDHLEDVALKDMRGDHGIGAALDLRPVVDVLSGAPIAAVCGVMIHGHRPRRAHDLLPTSKGQTPASAHAALHEAAQQVMGDRLAISGVVAAQPLLHLVE